MGTAQNPCYGNEALNHGVQAVMCAGECNCEDFYSFGESSLGVVVLAMSRQGDVWRFSVTRGLCF